MKESKPIYGFTDYEDCQGLVWETEKGMIVTINGKMNFSNNLSIKDVENCEEIKDVDMRNVLMEVLGF